MARDVRKLRSTDHTKGGNYSSIVFDRSRTVIARSPEGNEAIDDFARYGLLCEPVIGPATSGRTRVRNHEVALTCAHRPLIAGFIPDRRNSVRRKGDDQAHGHPDIGWLFAQSIPDADVGSISHMIRTSPGRAKGYLSFPEIFFCKQIDVLGCPSSVLGTRRREIWRYRHGCPDQRNGGVRPGTPFCNLRAFTLPSRCFLPNNAIRIVKPNWRHLR